MLIASVLALILAALLAVTQQGEKLLSLLLKNRFKSVKIKRPNKEKRIYPRYPTSLRVNYKTHQREGMSWAKDISRSGIRLFLDKPFGIGTFLEIEINLPYDPKPVTVRGNIVWAHAKRHNAGLSFAEVEQNDISRIFEYISHKKQIIPISL